HDGCRHFTVRRESAHSQFLPAWMTEPEAASAKIVADPLLPVNRLLELRALLDVLVALPRGESPPGEGRAHVQDNAKAATGSVRDGAGGTSASGGGSQNRKAAIGPPKGSRRRSPRTFSPVRSGGAS